RGPDERAEVLVTFAPKVTRPGGRNQRHQQNADKQLERRKHPRTHTNLPIRYQDRLYTDTLTHGLATVKEAARVAGSGSVCSNPGDAHITCSVSATGCLSGLATLPARRDTLALALCVIARLHGLSIEVEGTREEVEEQEHDGVSSFEYTFMLRVDSLLLIDLGQFPPRPDRGRTPHI
ncbi:hypothetical protein ACSVIJ_21025, partial [Pseudomonas sp. NCHU5208]|uniref:hypothetical protein n=1 Tax=Pseudomonas sp. NCHU5208 TaxID=3451354 RepID=UPI003F9D420C